MQQSPLFFLTIFGFILGTILGSFAKALADRSLGGKTFFGWSQCPHCHKNLSASDLIPILSYIFLKGRCRYCKKKIGTQYLLVEFGLGVVVSYLFYQTFLIGLPVDWYQTGILALELIFKVFFVTVAFALLITDLKENLIPDRVSMPSIVIALVFLVILSTLKVGYLYLSLSNSDIGKYLLTPETNYFARHTFLTIQPALLSLVSGFVIAAFFTLLIIITKGKGMGGGDVKLGALMGLFLGFPNSLIAIITAFFTGAIFSLGLILIHKKHFGQTIAFGPFLVLGSLIALFWGSGVVNWYLHFSY